MSVKTIDTKTALIVIDLQKGIVNLPSIHPISGIIKRSCALIDAFRQQCGLPVVARQRDRWCARSSREVMRSCFPSSRRNRYDPRNYRSASEKEL
jgi:hypothetical protein